MNERRTSWLSVGSIVFFALAPGSVAGLIPFLLTGWRLQAPFLGLQVFRVVGSVMVLFGVGSLVESFARFAIQGRGTPAPIVPPVHLVVSGQYRYVRNPMYVAVLLIVVGQSLILGSVALFLCAAALFLLFHAFVVLYEEPKLSARFGSTYRVYRQNVGRWWPRAKPWVSRTHPRPEERGRRTTSG